MEWSPTGRVFTTRSAEPLDAANVRRDFKAIVKKAGLKPEWTPRELRQSFVSLLFDHGIPLERIALLVGHSSQATTEAVYRKQLRPVITQGAEAMDDIFAEDQERGGSGGRGRGRRGGLIKFGWPPVWPPEHVRGHIRISVCGL